MSGIKSRIKQAIRILISPEKPRPINVTQASLNPNKLLESRTALITGGTSGIGYHIAKAFLNSGADVIITGRDKGRLTDAVSNLKQDTNKTDGIYYEVLDQSTMDFESYQIPASIVRSGEIDILVNNAGIIGDRMPWAKEEIFDKVIATNLKASFFLSQTFGKYLIKNNISGNILNIASSSSLRPAISAYTLSKWGLRGLTLGLAKSLAKYDITVNGLAPGPTATPMLLADGEFPPLPSSPIGRYILPDEIANMAVVLVSPLGKPIVGDIIYMTGGAGVLTVDDIETSFTIN